MTREYARVRLTIWADADFRKLTDPAQSLYFRLLTSPTINCCGVADWRPNRMTALTAGMTVETVVAAASELAAAGYIVVDEATEEALLRSFIRHDGIVKTPNITAAMVKDYAGTASELLRGVVIHELVRLNNDEPDLKGWAVARKLLTEPAINPSVKASVNPSPNPSTNPSVNPLPMGYPNPSPNPSPIPQPLTINQQPTTIPPADAEIVDEDFERFWSVYPKRIARRAAEKAWKSAIKRAAFEVILAGAKRYADHPDVFRADGQFIKAPATWLNADCWTDEIPPARPLGAVGKLSTADERALSGAALVAHYAAQEETSHRPQIGA